MNSRITLVSDTRVSIKRCEDVCCHTVVEITPRGLRMYDPTPAYYWDSDSQAALRDCINCLEATGSFAALADTSAVPFVGKRMLCVCNGFPECPNLKAHVTVLAKHRDDDDWIVCGPGGCDSHHVEPRALLPLVKEPKVQQKRTWEEWHGILLKAKEIWEAEHAEPTARRPTANSK